MTLEQTYQLGVEFERRLIEIDPSFEVENKVDTETIYKFLNQYAKQYVEEIMQQLMQAKNRDVIAYLQDKVKDLIRDKVCSANQPRILNSNGKIETIQENTTKFILPDDYYKYIRSYSNCIRSYKHPDAQTRIAEEEDEYITHRLENKVFNEYDDNVKVGEFLNDGFILRSPLVMLEGDHYRKASNAAPDSVEKVKTLSIFHDDYTQIQSVLLVYYTTIDDFSILGDDKKACDLSYSAFWDIVKGAVDMYIYSYKYGVTLESLKRKARQQIQDQQDALKQQRQQEGDQ